MSLGEGTQCKAGFLRTGSGIFLNPSGSRPWSLASESGPGSCWYHFVVVCCWALHLPPTPQHWAVARED